MVELLPLAKIEAAEVEQLLDLAFGADRFARTAYRLREGAAAIPQLSFALVEGGALIGTIQCWPVAHRTADGTATPLVMVGPVAVHPNVQRGGHGHRLMAHMLDVAEVAADGALMMIGDPEYYGRFFAFTADATGAWKLPGPFEQRRLLARAVDGYDVPTDAGTIGPR